MMMPDHVPTVEGDTNRLQGFAFAFGYIKALIAPWRPRHDKDDRAAGVGGIGRLCP